MRKPAIFFGAIVFMALLPAKTAHAGDATLPVTVSLIKCGDTKADLPKACKKNEACCVFLPPEDSVSRQPLRSQQQIINLAYQDTSNPFTSDPQYPNQFYTE